MRERESDGRARDGTEGEALRHREKETLRVGEKKVLFCDTSNMMSF